tara:strand:+ start:2320 stop:2487 length:168 start_codon:yes stop_codon:yes gene_type:complete
VRAYRKGRAYGRAYNRATTLRGAFDVVRASAYGLFAYFLFATLFATFLLVRNVGK